MELLPVRLYRANEIDLPLGEFRSVKVGEDMSDHFLGHCLLFGHVSEYQSPPVEILLRMGKKPGVVSFQMLVMMGLISLRRSVLMDQIRPSNMLRERRT